MKNERLVNVFIFMLFVGGLCLPVSADLIAYYSLDESSGNIANDSAPDSVDHSGLLKNFTFDNSSTRGHIGDAGGAIGNALEFDGINDFIQLERKTSQATSPPSQQVSSLGLEQFTLAAWFNKTGAGKVGSTGGGGVSGLAIISKGTGESDGNNKDMNYWLGIDTTANVIAADFESNASTDNNHPLRGSTVINDNEWYHISLTYDGSAMVLYLNGIEEARLVSSDTPRSDSIQPAAIGGALRSNFTSGNSLFEGMIDDARIYSHSLNETEVSNLFTEAVKEICAKYPAADVTGPKGLADCRVDIYDLVLLASVWLEDNMAINLP